MGRHGRDQGWQYCTGADLLEGRLWGSDCYDAGGRGAPEELCRRNGVFLFVAGFQAGSCWDLEAARPGPRQQWLPDASLFSGDWLQEVVERAGGSSADGMQHFSGLMGWVPRSGPTCSEGRSSSSRRSGRGGLHVCAEGQTVVIAVKLLHSEGRASGPLRRRSAVLEKSSEVGMMAVECGARSAQ